MQTLDFSRIYLRNKLRVATQARWNIEIVGLIVLRTRLNFLKRSVGTDINSNLPALKFLFLFRSLTRVMDGNSPNIENGSTGSGSVPKSCRTTATAGSSRVLMLSGSPHLCCHVRLRFASSGSPHYESWRESEGGGRERRLWSRLASHTRREKMRGILAVVCD